MIRHPPVYLPPLRRRSLLVSLAGAFKVLEGLWMLAFGVGNVLFFNRYMLRDLGIVPAGLAPLSPDEHVTVQPWIEVGSAAAGAILLGMAAVALLVAAVPLLGGWAVLRRTGRRLALCWATICMAACGLLVARWLTPPVPPLLGVVVVGFPIIGYNLAKLVLLLYARPEFPE